MDAREAAGHGARALNVHNEVGFGRKEATLVQAILYTLAPPDTVIVAPDSLWASPFWAGQLAGAALRGLPRLRGGPLARQRPGRRGARSSPARARSSRGSSRCAASWPARSRPRAATCASASTPGPPPPATRSARSARRRTASAGTRSSRTSSRCRRRRRGCSTRWRRSSRRRGYKPLFIAAGTREGRPKMHRKTQLFVTREALRAYADLPGGRGVAPRPARRPRESHRGPRRRSSTQESPLDTRAPRPRADEARSRRPARRTRSST